MDEVVLKLPAEQGKQLMDLLNIAVKAGGLGAAEAALPIATQLDKQLVEALGSPEKDEK